MDIKKLIALREMLIIPFVDFKPYSLTDIPRILVNSLIYDLNVMSRIIYKFFKRNQFGNPLVPFSSRIIIEYNGVQLIFETRPNSDDYYFLKPKYEENYLYVFCPKNKDVVLDVGAHVGRYSLYAGKKVGENGKVISIEANPQNYEQLVKNIRLNNLEQIVFPYNFAASDVNGSVELKVPKDSGRSSIIDSRVSGEKIKIIKIKSVRLEDFLEEIGIDKINWMKMDIEGAEIKALKGLGKYLNKIENILIEVSDENEKDFLKIMRKFNFHIRLLSRYSGQAYYFAYR